MRKVESISLSQNSLIKIVEDYHNEVCPGETCTNYAKRDTKVQVGFGPMGGVSYSQISYEVGGASFDLDYLPEGTSKGFSIGAFLNLSDPSISEKLSVQVEMAVFNAKFSTDISSLNLSTFKIPILFKYTFPSNKVQPSALLGISLNRFLKFENYTEDYGYLNLISGRSQYGLIAGIETAYKFNTKQGIFFQLRYEYCNGQNHSGEWGNMVGGFNTHLNNINILAGIMF